MHEVGKQDYKLKFQVNVFDCYESAMDKSDNNRDTLADDQLDSQIFYFITRLLQSSTCFEQRRTHH